MPPREPEGSFGRILHKNPPRYLFSIFLRIDLLLCAFRANIQSPQGKTT
nr:MAG TPA_asm: hypothetical protein [Caudoviricetes sp.]